MKTFDYMRAYDHVAVPAVQSLSADLVALVLRAGQAGRECTQDHACDLLWPAEAETASELQAALDAVPAADLAFAARAVHNVGHWRHNRGEPCLAALAAYGGHWRFSKYADQRLRVRFNIGSGERAGNGWHLEIHEGAIRLCWSSVHSWTWVEVAPADEHGVEVARELQAHASRKTSALPRNYLHKRDMAAYDYVERLRKADEGEAIAVWPERWRPLIDLSAFMVEEDELKAREAQHPDTREKTLATLTARRDQTIAKAQAEHARLSWLVEHGISLDNVIYYDHREMVTFGWRAPVSHEVTSQLLDVLSEYPFEYEIKSASRGVLSARE